MDTFRFSMGYEPNIDPAEPVYVMDYASSPLGLYLLQQAGGMRVLLWDKSQPLPNLPSTGVKPAFAVHGDVLLGDILAICKNPMTYFMRVEDGLSVDAVTQLFSAKNNASDTDGGAAIIYGPFTGQPGDSDGTVTLVAYGGGTGRFANAHRLRRRSGPGTVEDVLVIFQDRLEAIGPQRQSLNWADQNFVDRRLFPVEGIVGWTTVCSLVPSTVTGVYTMGEVEMTLVGDTGAVGNGARKSAWTFAYSSGPPTVAQAVAYYAQGTPGQVRLQPNGDAVDIQVCSNDGVHPLGGTLLVSMLVPRPSGISATFTIV